MTEIIAEPETVTGCVHFFSLAAADGALSLGGKVLASFVV